MIIGLVGVAGSGKTTAANFLRDTYGYRRVPFADPLKKMIEALGYDRAVLDGPAAGKEQPLEAFGGRTLREAMQTLGTEWGRAQFGDDFWVNQWANVVKDPQQYPHVVVDDVRFPNEAAKIKELGGFIIRITRDKAGASVGTNHASEQVDLIPWDVALINNSDDVRILYGQLYRILEQEFLRKLGD